MTITIDLTPDQSKHLSVLAEKQGLSAEEFARRELAELIERRKTVDAASEYVLHKNAELYRRLAQ